MKKREVTVSQILLGDNIGDLADKLMADGFRPDAIVVIGLQANTIRVRDNCRNYAELLGVLIAAAESIRGQA